MSTTTFNYGWVKPTIGGDASTWGAELNTDLDGIDAKVFANGSSMSVNAIGAATLPTFATAAANFTVNKAAGTNVANINGASNGVLRWVMSLGDATAEGGSNTGSDFDIRNYNDAGTVIGPTLTIQRSSGGVFVNGAGAAPNTNTLSIAAANLSINKAGSGSSANLNGMSNGVLRWQVVMGNSTTESGSNNGSGFVIQNYNDAGGVITPTPFQIGRSNSTCVFGVAIVNGPSDRSLKENVEPLQDALAKVSALQGVSFDWISDGRRDIGLIAQDVEPIVPEVMQWYDKEKNLLGIDYPKLVALLIEAVKTLSERVQALEGVA